MPKRFMACCLIVVFMSCIDEGNGNWKKKNREKLQNDIAKFKEMAERIDDEIEDFYDQYSDKWPKDEYVTDEENKYFKLYQNKLQSNANSVTMISANITNNFTKTEISPIPKNIPSEEATPKIDVIKEISSSEKAIIATKWPKFEDILLEMGKKYDWKNDRWIKVKKKTNQSNEENHSTSHDRHKFRYKTVKLNRGKSRRNVVIAVTAVR